MLRGFAAGLVFGALWMVHAVTSHILETSDIFTIKVVEIRGNQNVNVEWLKDLYLGMNIFNNVEPSLPLVENEWVAKVEMKRVMPDKLQVNIYEEIPVLRYRYGDECYTRTATGKDISTHCSLVNVLIAEAGVEEFELFAKLYKNNDVLQNNNVVLRNGFFWVTEDNVTLIGNFVPGVFSNNYRIYTESIKPIYKAVDKVDLTVGNRVYVKGVL